MPAARRVPLHPASGPDVLPDGVATSDDPRRREIQAALDLVRPAIRDDGGDVELVDVDHDTVRIRFKGACVGCPSSSMTLQYGIEKHLVEHVPGVSRVVALDTE